MVEQSVLANSSKFIEGPWEKEESDLANSSSVVINDFKRPEGEYYHIG